MTLVEFERQIYAVAAASPICGVPFVRRLTATSLNVRIDVVSGGFITFQDFVVAIEQHLRR